MKEIMKKKSTYFCILLWIVIIIFSCGSESKSTEETVATETEHPGKKVYNMYCITCHGYDGTMGANGAHNLKLSELTKEEQILVVQKGRNTMTAFEKVISQDKIESVVDYIQQLRSIQ
jgi:cytochrome c6